MTLRKTFIFFAALLSAVFCRAENAAVAGGSEFSEGRAAKILAEKTVRLESVSKKIAAARDRIEELESALAARADSDSASRFYDAQAAELSAKLAAFESELPCSVKSARAKKMSAPELSAHLSLRGQKWLDALLKPLSPIPFTAVSASDGSTVGGEFFRVGAFGYFVAKDSRAGFVSPDGVLYGEKFGGQIRAFAEGKSHTLPADISGGAVLADEKSPRGFWGDVERGGIFMLPILLFALLSAAVAVWKTAQFWRMRNPYSLLSSAFEKSGADGNWEDAAYAVIGRVERRLRSRLSVLSVTAAVAPLFGLLGTVSGIVKTFAGLSLSGAAQAKSMGAGIAEALITTEYGLAVAIASYVAYALLSRRVRAEVSKMEDFAEKLADGK